MSNDDSYFELRADFIDALSAQELKIIRDTLMTNKDSVRAKLYAIISDPTNDNYIDNTAVQEMFLNDSYSFDLSFEAFYIDNNYNTITQSIPVYEPPAEDEVIVTNTEKPDVEIPIDYTILEIVVNNTIPSTTLASLSQNQQDIITQSYIDNYVTLFTTIAGVTESQIRPNITSVLSDDGSTLNVETTISNFQTEAQYTSATNLSENLPANFLTNVSTTITTKFQELVDAAAAQAAADAQAAQAAAEQAEADAQAAKEAAEKAAADALAAQQAAAAEKAAAEAAQNDFSNVEQTYENTLEGVELNPNTATSDEDLTTIAIYKDSYVQTYEEKIKEQLIADGAANTDLVKDNIVIEFVPDPQNPGNTKVKVTVQNIENAADLATINTIIENLNSSGTIASEVQTNVDTAIDKRQTASIDTKIGGTFADLDTTETDAIIAKAKEQVAANFSIPVENITVTLEEDANTGEIVVKTSMIGVKNREKQSLENTTNQNNFESALTTAITTEPALQEVANDANNPIVVDSEPPAPPKEAKIEMKLEGIDLTSLPASAKSAIENNAKANVASSFGVPLDTISVILQQGSVNIVIKVLNPPAESEAAFSGTPIPGGTENPATAFLTAFQSAVTNDPDLAVVSNSIVYPDPVEFAASAVTAPVTLPPITLDSTSFEIPITTGNTPGEPTLAQLTEADKQKLIDDTIENVNKTFDVPPEDITVTIFEDENGAIIIKTFVENTDADMDAALDSSSNMVAFAGETNTTLGEIPNASFPPAPAPAPAAPVVVTVPVSTVVVAVAVVDDSGTTTPVSDVAAVQTAKNNAVISATEALDEKDGELTAANDQVTATQATLSQAQEAVISATNTAVAAAQTATDAQNAAASAAAEQQATNEAATNSQSGTSSSTAQEEPVLTINDIPQETRDKLVSDKINEILASDTSQTLTADDIVVTLSMENNEVIMTVIITATEASAQAVQEAAGLEIDRFLLPFVGRGIKVIPNASSSMGIADKRRAAIAAGKKNNSVANNPTPSAQFSFLRGRLRRARSSGAVAPRKTNYR